MDAVDVHVGRGARRAHPLVARNRRREQRPTARAVLERPGDGAERGRADRRPGPLRERSCEMKTPSRPTWTSGCLRRLAFVVVLVTALSMLLIADADVVPASSSGAGSV